MKINTFGIQASGEDKILLRNIEDKIELSEKHFSPKFTFFLDERQCALVDVVLKNSGYDNYILYGGFDSAKRKVLAVAPPYSYADFPEFPIKPITFEYRTIDVVTHRDILGSLMALNIERRTVGDILVSEGKSAVFLYDSVVPVVLENIRKIGRVGVGISEGFDEKLVPVQLFKEISGTVASLRLDCVVSLALGISRGNSSALIKKTGVTVNHKSEFSSDFVLNVNDCFSVKGYGKFLFSAINGVSKKERIHITIKKYL